ncbi:hypothetical protein SPRG_05660 [Saprolegnia parasitica CBS 223.65]|uniref:Uncharacterized protein n=1 Tax=Saprolegnia parasitica (strain CBS 223.65) TaxID=695850 RepID=A0A067CG64_SAPPC|nr:hypothetical protein SPRG_05660 [Saprolegnia parasitica CBS 223.65]KDO29709.1 hypothetical protein SPRG_05660 [Saprolegnia parasitica CBS 223.65]|eukprot:XP_012199765.1 hypothetical protein SPRG_05660 [Saprolegnia parasitica CBS 223.65]
MAARSMGSHATRRPWLLCADFDDTISAKDTIQDLALLACAARGASSAMWSQLSQQYMDEYTPAMASIPRTSPSVAYDHSGLATFLRTFSAVDKSSIDRVVASRVLAGLSHAAIADGATSLVTLQPDAASVLSQLSMPLALVSSNWSCDWLAASMGDIPVAAIYANDLVFGDNGISTGDLALRMQSPFQKAQRVTTLQDNASIVYIGDGVNDLLALLAADVGIVFGNPNASASRVARRFGVRLVDLVDEKAFSVAALAAHAATAKAENAPLLFRAPSWHILGRFLR